MEKKLRVFLFCGYDTCSNCMAYQEHKARTHACGAKHHADKHKILGPVNKTPPYGKTTAKYLRTSSDRKKAKSCNNVVHQCPVWDIELTHVSPPYLHILLEQWKNIICYSSRLSIILTKGQEKNQRMKQRFRTPHAHHLKKYSQSWRKILQSLEERERETETRAAWLWPEDFPSLLEYEDTREDLLGDAEELSQQIDHLKSQMSSHFSQDLSLAVLMMH